MQKVRETYADTLGDLINLDFAPKAAQSPHRLRSHACRAAPGTRPAAEPEVSAAELARGRSGKKE